MLKTFLLPCFVALVAATTLELTQIGASDYYISATEASFLEAQFLCQQNGMEIVAFETETEFRLFNNTMDQWQINDSVSYWIGGLRLKNGRWYWASTKSVFTYSDWGTNEPHCPSEIDLCCSGLGIISRTNNEPRKWCAYKCTEERLFFCEIRS